MKPTTLASSEAAEIYAAIDLGSNSFHLLVAKRTHGELRVLDRIKEMVQLGGGLDASGRLDEATRMRAIDCLARFGQRLRGIPAENIRAVGTQTLRRMHNANSFLMVVETALGCPVDIISGREEARLIYLGVSQGVAGSNDRRLVIDIGGGSTEIIVGSGQLARELESLQFGCVFVTRQFFPDGRIDQERWQRALGAVRAELQEFQLRYRQAGWDRAIGSSGTIRAVAEISRANGWGDRHITTRGLAKLCQRLLDCGHAQAIDLAGLSERRRPVIAGGVIILQACFDALGIETMEVSPFALREGVLHDLLGRLEHRDPRDHTVEAFMSRYGVEANQASRVREAALTAFDQIAGPAGLNEHHRESLAWAAKLHETGLGISHSHYQQHSGYLVESSDMAGFSRQEQQFLAALVRYHRRDIPASYADELPARLREPLRCLLICLRLAWILCRTREDAPAPVFDLRIQGQEIHARFAPEWLTSRPLTAADLETEQSHLAALGLNFHFSIH
jgi:exopolyphosphatase/guanosine-5'-triphosphate,3'-diphosphate pyrophosphatase